jgi:predicted amidohydrolase YtcJ
MREAHTHIAAFGQSLTMPSLADCASLAECLDRVRDAAANVKPGEWVRLLSARVESWPERRWPTITELDRAAPHRPCAIMSFDHHAAAANSAAMRAGGLRAGIPVPPSGTVCVDEHGEPTGLLLEHAAYKVWDAAPEPTREQSRENVRASLQALHALGYTEVHDLHSQDWLGPILADLDRNGEMPMERVLLYPNVDRVVPALSWAKWESDRFWIGGAKIFADGTLNNRTALMLAPYAEPREGLPCGQAMISSDDLKNALRMTGSMGIELAVHAIGDGAVRMVLDAWEHHPAHLDAWRARRETAADATSAHGTRKPRLRIEHCELIDEADIPRFAKLNVIASVQPCHLLSDIEVLTRQLPHRLDRVLPIRDLIDSGAEVWFGSDVPIVRANAEDSFIAATQRRRADMPQSQSIAWNQRITEAEARRAFRFTREDEEGGTGSSPASGSVPARPTPAGKPPLPKLRLS